MAITKIICGLQKQVEDIIIVLQYNFTLSVLDLGLHSHD